MDRHWVEIDEARLAGNLCAVREVAGNSAEVLAVVKADAYGHGAELCAGVLARAGARWFGVTDAAEGVRVRGVVRRDAEILVMCGSLAEETAVIREHGLVPVVWTAAQVGALRELQRQRIQIEIDTGMGRQGVRPGADFAAILAAVRDAGLVVDGVFTHLCAAEAVGSEVAREQQRRFEEAVLQVRAAGVQPEWIHIANSSGADNPQGPGAWLDGLARSVGARTMVRAGLALYGYVLPLTGPKCEEMESALRPKLRPVLAWKARVLAVRVLAEGESVGYGATFTAPRAMRVALLPVGYADGLRRELSGPATKGREGGWVMVRGRRCAVVGRVSMNLTVVDVSGMDGVAEGEVVTLLGEGVTAEDHARVAGTIAYEILCGLRSVPRATKPR